MGSGTESTLRISAAEVMVVVSNLGEPLLIGHAVTG